MNEKYIVYQFEKSNCAIDEFHWEDLGYILKIKKFSIEKVLRIRIILFLLASRGKHKIYCLYDKKGLAHYSFLIPYCPKFSFMKKDDYFIGPCWTREDCRGQGLYGKMLSYIAKDVIKKNRSSDVHGLIREANVESTRGIRKACFKEIGFCQKTKYLKHYKSVIGDDEKV